jgi:hypothetical protein
MNLDDTVNLSYGGTQICGARSRSILEGGTTPEYLSVAGNKAVI